MCITKRIFKMFVGAAVVAIVLFGCGGGGSGGGKLVTEVSPKDGGTVSRDIMQDRYPAGTNVTLTAEPTQGYRFKEWTGAVSGNTNTISVATIGNMKVTAVFEELSKSGPQLVDPRDGKTYRTVVIGNQTWMAEDLSYNIASAYTACGKYSWNLARNACPAGWHLPTEAEWDTLVNLINPSAGRKLKATSGNGTDDFGFTALLHGYSWGCESELYDGGVTGMWWTATEEGARFARNREMSYNSENVGSSRNEKNIWFSVRCVKDN